MRFVDEYRAPEQVMQLIEHLRERASHLSYTAERPPYTPHSISFSQISSNNEQQTLFFDLTR